MVIDQVHVSDIRAHEAKDEAPVAGHGNCPATSEPTLQRIPRKRNVSVPSLKFLLPSRTLPIPARQQSEVIRKQLPRLLWKKGREKGTVTVFTYAHLLSVVDLPSFVNRPNMEWRSNERLTFRHTDVYGNVVHELIA